MADSLVASPVIQRFDIEGLFGLKNVSLKLNPPACIIVGPNGIGKSTVANIFYLFVSRQWTRLLEYRFDALRLVAGDTDILVRRDEISGLADLRKLLTTVAPSSKLHQYFDTLLTADSLETFATTKRLTLPIRDHYSSLLKIPREEVGSLHRWFMNRLSPEGDLFTPPRVVIERQLSEMVASRLLFLPTYRRIEKDIKDIFPDFEDRYRRLSSSEITWPESRRSGSHYVELVSFGMEDVRLNIQSKTQELRNYSLSQYNALSGSYLRDVIRGVADRFTAVEINALTESSISSILDRVQEAALSQHDKSLLRNKIASMKGKKKKDIPIHDRFLAHYFSRLLAATQDIRKRESDITSFVEVCNRYIRPSKEFVYDDVRFSLAIVDDGGREIDLSMLSSGEKQIISIFAHIYLEDISDQIVVIDEPELSLSVPWQKSFLPDIIASGRCRFLLAVTHSPFIYDNELNSSSIDLRRVTSVGGA